MRMKFNKSNFTPKSIAFTALMTAITIGLSFIRIPFIVPFTLQTLACMLAGLLLPAKEATVSQLLYILLGLLGLPIFTGGGGLAYIIYPTFGYILYMPAMTLTIALLKQKNTVLAMVAAIVPQLAFGLLYYYFIVTVVQGAQQQLAQLFSVLVLPFLPAELLKAVAALLLYRYFPNSLKNS